MICKVCGEEIGDRSDNIRRHYATHNSGDKKYKCNRCTYESNRIDNLKRHIGARHRKEEVGIERESKRKRKTLDGTTDMLDGHNRGQTTHASGHVRTRAEPTPLVEQSKHGYNLEPERDEELTPPIQNTALAETAEVQRVLAENRWRIETYEKRNNRMQDIYNFKLNSGSLSELMQFVSKIYQDQEHPFKLNVSFGFLLQNYFTRELVFYYASHNTRLFEQHPIMVETEADLIKVSGKLGQQDLLEYARMQRPNTKYVVVLVSNAYFYVDKLKQFSIGCCGGVDLPEYIKHKTSVIAFDRQRDGQPYNDCLCFFRCLAYHKLSTTAGITSRARLLLEEYCAKAGKNARAFHGVKLQELQIMEDIFELNIEVFALSYSNTVTETGDTTRTVVSRKVQSSRSRYSTPAMNLNLFDCHFSYIANIKAYSGRWCCSKCDKLFNRLSNMKVHVRNCDNKTRYVFPGGGYGQKKSLFDSLKEHGVAVPDTAHFYPYRLAFDFECFFEDLNQSSDRKQQLLNRLIPASVSICSNVPGYTSPRCIVSTGNPNELIGDMYQYIVEVSRKSHGLMESKFASILSYLSDRITERQEILAQITIAQAKNAIERVSSLRDSAYRLKIYETLYDQLQSWLRRIVCLGFNSGKFDINLIRKYLFPYFLKNGVNVDYIIKRTSDYISITTHDCIFLDIKNYIAAGVSYKRWIESNDIQQTKGHFPYEWFTSLEKLDQTVLPPQREFWSSLKQCGIADEDYQQLQILWQKRGFKNMRDFLIYYNNLDVVPFLHAAEKLHDYWMGLGIDPFKGRAVSLSGLALEYLTCHMKPHTILPLFRTEHDHVFHLIRQNIVGGLSIVCHRYHEKGVTRLPNGRLVAWVYSYDCNSLYLWALGEPTGTGVYRIWSSSDHAKDTPMWRIFKDDDSNADRHHQWEEVHKHNMNMIFSRKSSYTYGAKELEYLEWTTALLGKRIEHRFNGRQKVVLYTKEIKYPVDGYMPEENTVIQFHGCYHHGHGCNLDSNSPLTRLEKRRATTTMTARIRSLGFQVIEKWECEWEAEKKTNPAIQQFIDNHLRMPEKRTRLTSAQLLDGIRQGKIFGMIECDIEVPSWDPKLVSFFEEFPPICKNVSISISDIGEHMRRYAEQHGYMSTPRKNLINSFWAHKILLTTPLVCWMLAKGLRISRIYQVIEMKPKRCFAEIRDEIADHRRRADNNPAYKPAGESWKTLGNSLYGKTMTVKEKHKDCKLAVDKQASYLVNNPRFHSMEEIGDIAYEVQLDKRKIRQDLPVTVAFFVYNYAKLRMLEFVYDFLKHYLRRGSYQIVCSDTDSIIAAYESRNIDDLIRPELLSDYHAFGKKAFLSTCDHTKRTPGLYKEELAATGIIALCSKTYFAWNDEDGSTKVSSKGLSKQTNQFTRNTFMDVLETGNTGSGINYGFKVKRDEMFNYKETRFGLPYLYAKRQVLEDGVSTTALHL